MANLLTLSRAARLVGVTRGELQQRIRRNELETFEGKVRASDLLRAFPEAHLEDDSALERVNRIKAAATPQKEPKYELPTPEVLAGRLTLLSHELTDARAELANYSELVGAVAERLDTLAATADGALRDQVQGLRGWLDEQMRQRPRVPKRKAELQAKDTFLRMLAAQVQVIPSGHEFFVEGNDTILAAGMRAGLALKYGCTSGSCGSCKARVVAGRVLKVRDHEYEISDTERDLGYVLMCSYTAVTDLTLEAAEAKGGDDIPHQAIDAAVRSLGGGGDEVTILRVQTPANQPLRFLAGQRVALTLPSGASQELPLACCPCDSRNLEVHVRRGAGTAFADEVCGGGLEVGAPVHVSGPLGEPLTEPGDASPLLFIAHEGGFAALKGFIENTISGDAAAGYHVVWVTEGDAGRYLDNLCRSWTDALENFDYQPLVVAGGGAEDTGRALDAALDDYPDLDNCRVYVAGAEAFTAAVLPVLRERGITGERLQLRGID